MQSWLKKLMTGAIAFGASWTGALGYWRSTNRLPGGADLAFWLVAVPVLLLLAAWGTHALYRRAQAPSAPAGNVAAPEAAVQASTSAPASAPAAAAALAIVASAVRTPFGHTAVDLRAALAAGEARPALDPELEDADGYPVLTARIADADAGLAALRSAFAGSDSQHTHFTDAQWRALAFADAAVSELGDLLAHADAAKLPLLQLHAVWTDEWTAPQRTAANDWLHGRLGAAGWPFDRIVISPTAADLTTAPALVAQLLAQAGEPLLAVVLASGSQLDTATVDAMAAANTLFSARQPDGQIPGEGACALLLADAASARLLADEAESVPALRALASTTLEQSADKARQPDTQVLPTLLAQSLERARCTPAQVVLASADGGRHPNRIRELMALAGGHLPQLDPIADLARTGEAWTGCAPLAWLAALAVAADAAHEHHGAALCIGNLDPVRRDLAVVAATDFTQ
jgi:hypothetical protein